MDFFQENFMKSSEKKKIDGHESRITLLILLLAAILFHALFFLLFKPVKNEKSIKNPGKAFTLLLSPKKAEELQLEYGLSYFLASSDPSSIMKIQQKHGFGAWERLSESSPFSKEFISGYTEKGLAARVKKDPFSREENLSGTPPLSFLSLLPPPVPATDFPEGKQGEKKYISSESRAEITAKDFPFWKFSTGKVLKGLPANISGSRETVQKWKEKAVTYTQYRIVSSQGGTVPELFLLRSCGVKELDDLAKKELYVFLGDPFGRSVPEKEKSCKNFYCTILWSEKLILPEKEIRKKEKK